MSQVFQTLFLSCEDKCNHSALLFAGSFQYYILRTKPTSDLKFNVILKMSHSQYLTYRLHFHMFSADVKSLIFVRDV